VINQLINSASHLRYAAYDHHRTKRVTARRKETQLTKQSLREKGLTPTDCANLYLRYCLMNLPYDADAFQEVADIAPLKGAQYTAVQKALRSKLASLIKKADKPLCKNAPDVGSIPEVQGPMPELTDGPHVI
jgi:hypothetical protein